MIRKGAQGPQELVRYVQEAGYCIGCGACVGLCPYFRNHEGRTVYLFPCDLKQGRCHAHCPKTGVEPEALSRHLRGRAYDGQALGYYSSVRAGRAGQRFNARRTNLRYQGGARYQGGGAVSALMGYALSRGEIDGAVLTGHRGLWPEPQLVTTVDGIIACGGSKFSAAPTLAAMNRAVEQGYQRLGLVGTPCQMTAVAQMKRNPLQRDNFNDPVALTIGLFCNWALSSRQWVPYLLDSLKSGYEGAEITGFDIPPPPADMLCVRTTKGELEIPLREIRAFIPRACNVCPDLTSEWADISVGMFEGQPGWNTLIVRSASGERIVNGAAEAGYLELKPMPESSLHHLRAAANRKQKKALRRLEADPEGERAERGEPARIRMPADILNKILSR